ncbi:MULTISPECIES: MFS transporter [unclassified Streptomyces]|uniref:MFS transporter n=1 Tax=unclassified Streptomyces TaxID=2593676 RepID=UPI000DC79142|nr:MULTISPECIES: MFS transporter [unclassified Streptomyces]AWZ10238.1 MFS transporter [Streptomyces sp. ICC4]AWZ17896.1 MFS transporter [Streptomyces sp. ICC1]
MDNSVLYLAMPSINGAISPSAGQALWIVDIYGFVVASLLIAFGSLGDRHGRLKFLLGGAMLFGIGSAGAMLAGSPELLIASRGLMGLGGATLLPSGLAIVSNLFPDPKQRARAIGIFAATFAAGFAVGPVAGGLLLDRFWWGSVFLINLPVVVVFLTFAPKLLKDVREARPGRVDALSVAQSAAGILLAVYSVKALAAEGFSAGQSAAGIAGVAILVWFVRRQFTLEEPLLDLKLFRDRVFTVAVLTGLLSLVAWAAAGYLSGVYLQSVLGFSVLTAAFLALPGAAVLTAACIGTAGVVERIGKRAALIASHFFIGAGLLLLLFTGTTGGAALYIASTVIAGVGYGLSFSLVAETAVAAVPPERAGSAGAIAEMSNELGGALGISLLGSLAAFLFRFLGPGTAGTLDTTLATPGLSGETAAQAKDAFVTGLHAAIGVAAALTFALGFLALRWLPREERNGEPELPRREEQAVS